MRIATVDGLRGYFLLQMMATHIAFVGPPSIGYATHHRLGFVEDAQGFVLLSGFVIALVYGRMLERTSFSRMRAGLWARARQLYVYNALSLAAVFVAALGPFGAGEHIRDMARIGDAAWQDAVLSLTLIDGPAFVDILPMYICLMVVTPWILRALYADRTAPVVVASVAVWIVAQTGLQTLLGDRLELATGIQSDGGLGFGLHFNRLGWQLVFVAGLIGGVMMRRGALPLDRLREPQFRTIFHIALVVSLMFFAIRLAVAFDLLDWSDSVLLSVGLDRASMSILRVANFAADAYLVLYLLTAGQEAQGAIMRPVAQALGGILRLPPLVFLGQHSLQVYTLHVVLIYVVATLVPEAGVSRLAAAAILLACWAALFVPGLWKTRVLPRLKPAPAE